MMAFHHRKFQISEADSDCYMCYVCPENCYVSPPPPQLSPPPPPPPQFSSPSSSKNHIPTVLILMLCVLGAAFLVLSYLTLARYRCRNSRSRNPEPLETSRTNFLDENHGPVLDHPIWYIRTVGLPQSVIDSITSFTYRKGGVGLIDGNDCAVCLNDFQENETLRLLPKCSHAFHLDCIDTWLRSHKNCPVCRAPVVTGHARASSVESSPSSSGSNEVARHELARDQFRHTLPDHGMDDTDVVSKNGRVLEARIEKLGVVTDLQPVRRSVSMDFSMIKNSSINYRVMKSCSLPNGAASMKRSFSFSGKRSPIHLPEIDMQNQGR